MSWLGWPNVFVSGANQTRASPASRTAPTSALVNPNALTRPRTSSANSDCAGSSTSTGMTPRTRTLATNQVVTDPPMEEPCCQSPAATLDVGARLFLLMHGSPSAALRSSNCPPGDRRREVAGQVSLGEW